MPWSQTSPMDQRLQFIADYQPKPCTMTELCERFRISRKTGYKWIERFEAEGPAGLLERSRRPNTCPHEIPSPVVRALLEARRHHPTWGAKKLLAILARREPDWLWPARSTACDLLRRHGLIAATRRRRRLGHPGRPQTPMTAPNDIWTADFTGQFRTGGGATCFPLTVADGFSRYLLGCQGLPAPTHAATHPVFRRLFQAYGLLPSIRTDNGVPFATSALGRLSRLSVWWIRLGIAPELIEPAHPEHNGRHARMHRPVTRDTAWPSAATLAAQQRRFTRFREEFNHLRPHEALGHTPPASAYTPSDRPFPARLAPLAYPPHFAVRLVSQHGGIRWNSHWGTVSHVLAEEYVGLEDVDNGLWNVYVGPLHLGRRNEEDLRIQDHLGRKSRKSVLPICPD